MCKKTCNDCYYGELRSSDIIKYKEFECHFTGDIIDYQMAMDEELECDFFVDLEEYINDRA